MGEHLNIDELHAIISVYNPDTKKWTYVEPQNGKMTKRFADEEEALRGDNAGPNLDAQPNTPISIINPELSISIQGHVSDNPNPQFAGLAKETDPNTITLIAPPARNGGLAKYNWELEEVIRQHLKEEQTRKAIIDATLKALPVIGGTLSPAAYAYLRHRNNIRKEAKAAGKAAVEAAVAELNNSVEEEKNTQS